MWRTHAQTFKLKNRKNYENNSSNNNENDAY